MSAGHFGSYGHKGERSYLDRSYLLISPCSHSSHPRLRWVDRVSPWEAPRFGRDGESGQEARSLVTRTALPGILFTGAAVLGWTAVAVNLFTHTLNEEALASLRIGSLTVSIVAGFGHLAERLQEVMRAHTKAMTQHVLAVERFFALSARAETQLGQEVRATGTGPFKMYRGGAG